MNWKNTTAPANDVEDDIEMLRADAKKYREQVKKDEVFNKKVSQIREQWQKDSEALKRIVSDFDFEKAMQNRAFYERIMSGDSIPMAYIAANMGKQDAPVKRRVIVQNGQSTANANGSPEANIAGMSDDDFQKYIRKLKNR